MLTVIAYICIGAISGLFAGLLGLGGGVVIVPLLDFILTKQGYSSSMAIAIGTSLATMIFSTSSAFYSHYQDKEIQWPVFKKMILGIVLGAPTGQILVTQLSHDTLKDAFSIFLLMVCARLWFEIKQRPTSPFWNSPKALPIWFIIGFSLSVLSSMMGLAGGLIMIPIFMFIGLNHHQAKATSISISAPLVIFSAISSFIAAHHLEYSPYLLGHIYWPGALVMGLTTLLITPVGVALSKKLPVRLLQRLFSLVLLLVVWKMMSDQ